MPSWRAALLAAPLLASGSTAEPDICSARDTGFHDPNEQAVVCYVGTFMTKMLTELESSAKTSMHVRGHLLPFIGGAPQIEALRTDSARSGNCTVCYGSNATADGLGGLRQAVPKDQVAMYDSLKVCYMQLTDAIMDAFPKSAEGSRLVVPKQTAPFALTTSIFRGLFAQGGLRHFTGCEEVPEPPKDRKQLPWDWIDVCDPKAHGLTDPTEAAVFCYMASFMSKMMWELTLCPPLGWCRKTEQHVRMHFTPYVGGAGPTAAVATDDPSNATCTACYSDDVCADHQARWLKEPCCYDNSTTHQCNATTAPVDTFLKAKQVYDSLNVCYVPLANYFMEALPKVGHWLVAPQAPETPFTTALRITKTIWRKHGIRACGEPAVVVV